MYLAYKRARKFIYQRTGEAYDRIRSRILAPRYRDIFKDLESFCLFLGYGRSGHSMFGALLDAHENVIMGHEVNALQRIRSGYGRDQLFYLLLQSSIDTAARGRITSGYNYNVAGQWQGRFSSLKVIGDKKGGGSAKVIAEDPGIIDRLKAAVGLPVRCVHIIRNPYDNITTIARRKKHMAAIDRGDIERAFEHYFSRVKSIAAIRKTGVLEILDIRLEDFIAAPRDVLARICRFIGVEPSEEYLQACSAIVYKKPNRSRLNVQWPPDLVRRVADEISSADFLAGYAFES